MKKVFIPLATVIALSITACGQTTPSEETQTDKKVTTDSNELVDAPETKEEFLSEEEAMAQMAEEEVFPITMTEVPIKDLPFNARQLHGPDLQDAIKVEDINGTYYLLRNKYFSEGTHYMRLAYYHWKEGKIQQDAPQKEYELENCNFDLINRLPQGSMQIRDEDNDGAAEIYSFSQLDCVSDVSPLNLDLHIFEGKNHYMLTGTTKVDDQGGTFTPSDNLKENPKILSVATDLFNYQANLKNKY